MELLRQKNVITRKPHVCFGCGREFSKGTHMRFEVWKDVDINSAYLCEMCQCVIREILSEEHYFEYGFGDLRESALEYESKIRQEVEK